MYEGSTHQLRPRAAARRSKLPAPIGARPDRVALWAVFVAVFTIVVAVTTSAAQGSYRNGGVSPSGDQSTVDQGASGESSTEPVDSYIRSRLGSRPLIAGMRGTDVRVLQSILRGQNYARLPVNGDFSLRTRTAVKRFERDTGLTVDGVVDRSDTRALVRTMRAQRATWYGPGFYGNRTACGQTLSRRTVGVAHRSLPCGTKVAISYRGRFVTTRVIDRGPYAHGAHWDLTYGAARKVGLRQTARIRYAVYSRARGQGGKPRRKGLSEQNTGGVSAR